MNYQREKRVFDPALGAKDRTQLQDATASELRATEPFHMPPLYVALRYTGKGLMCAFITAAPLLLKLGSGSDELGRHGGFYRLFQETNHAFFTKATIAILVVTFCVAVIGALNAHDWNKRARSLHTLRDHCVVPGQLTEVDAELLSRAQAAVETVTASTVHSEDEIDQQRNQVELPQRLWDLAVRLRNISKATAAETPTIAARQTILSKGRDDVERRVEQLEQYAAKVTEADYFWEGWALLKEADATKGDLLDIVAPTPSPELSAAERDHLNGTDTDKAELDFREAVQVAKRAADEAFAT